MFPCAFISEPMHFFSCCYFKKAFYKTIIPNNFCCFVVKFKFKTPIQIVYLLNTLIHLQNSSRQKKGEKRQKFDITHMVLEEQTRHINTINIWFCFLLLQNKVTCSSQVAVLFKININVSQCTQSKTDLITCGVIVNIRLLYCNSNILCILYWRTCKYSLRTCKYTSIEP